MTQAKYFQKDEFLGAWWKDDTPFCKIENCYKRAPLGELCPKHYAKKLIAEAFKGVKL